MHKAFELYLCMYLFIFFKVFLKHLEPAVSPLFSLLFKSLYPGAWHSWEVISQPRVLCVNRAEPQYHVLCAAKSPLTPHCANI